MSNRDAEPQPAPARLIAWQMAWPLVAIFFGYLLPALHALGCHEQAIALVQEDRGLEWLGAVASLAGGALLLATAWRLTRTAREASAVDVSKLHVSGGAIGCALLGVLLLVMGAEEMSWGQRWLGFGTPAWMGEHNIQREFNLHNLRLFHPELENNRLKLIWTLASVAYLGLAPLLARAAVRRRARRLPMQRDLATLGQGKPVTYAAPIAPLGVALAALVAGAIYFLETARQQRLGDLFAAHDAGEACELTLELLYLAVAVGAWRSAPGAPLMPQARGVLQGAVGLVLVFGVLDPLARPTLGFDGRAYYRLGALHERESRFGAAETAYRQALQVDPADSASARRLASLLFDAARFADTAMVLDEAIRHAPEDASLHSSLGVTSLRLGDLDAAATAFARAMQLAPDWSEPVRNLGLTREQQGQREEARALLTRALELKPDDKIARDALDRLGQ